MNPRVLAVFAVFLCVVSASAVLLSGVDASDDAEWRDPPSADYVIEIVQDLTFKSNDPEYELAILSTDGYVDNDVFPAVSEDSQDDMAEFVKRVRNLGIYTEIDNPTSDGWTDACLPSWINAEIVGNDGVFGENHEGILITIMPALQAVAEDTHGDYWIYYSTTQSGGSTTTNTKTFIFTFSVDVEWNGGVVVPDDYNRFVACIDWGTGYVQELTPVTFGSNVTSARFSVPDAPAREGYEFVGLSTSPSGAVISGDLVVTIGASNVTESDSGDGGTLYTGMFYAVWEYQSLVIPTMWDELAVALSDPLVLLVLVVGFLATCLFVRNRTREYY